MCSFPNCKNHGEPYCIQHGKLYGSKPVKVNKPIPKQSEKRKKEQREYKKIIVEMLSENGKCELMIPGVCTGTAQGLDHVQKRSPKNFLERSNLKRSCNACNGAKENHPELADKLGLSKSKFKK